MPTVVIAPPEHMYSRDLSTWFALAAAAGMVNIGAFLSTERFVSHITGTVAHSGVPDAGPVLLEALAIVGAFILGAMVSVLPLQARGARGLPPRTQVSLLCVAALLTAVAALGGGGFFGPFGQTLLRGSTGVLVTLSFAMGLQNATISSMTARVVRTTHLTGSASDLGVDLGTAVVTAGDPRREALRSARLRFGKLVSFALGAAAMVPLARGLGWWSFAVPALVVVVCTATRFGRGRR